VPNKEDTNLILEQNTRQEDFLKCLEASTACIKDGIIVHLLGMNVKSHIGECNAVIQALADYDMWI
jgi:hypothetical protein